MAVDLIYKHQQKTYDLMNEALEKSGRAAYVYPTGCGKSFPALKYIEDNSEKSATIVVPSNFIRKQYEKNIKKYVENGGERLKSGSIKIVTYQNQHFQLKKHEERVKIKNQKYRELIKKGIDIRDKKLKLSKILIPRFSSDIVIFDEIHRMGAPEWEKIVDKMMKENPKRKVIGMSATPERTNRRNMAYEKFGDDVVYEMSLTEALSGEKEGEVLLKSPNYVRVLSLLKSELPKYKEQIDLLGDEEKKDKCLKAYQKLDTIVSNSPDIQDIIAAGMKKTNGKYIVFCKDRDDMFDKIEHANEIFGKVNSKINIDYVITKKSGGEDTKGKTKVENDKTLDEFETRENGDGLNLLFCVDMLNEGVHLEGIDGEILFDLTSSPILYKQRIGRVLSSDKNAGDAVIIDAANNWLTQIETYREIEMAIQAGQKREKGDEEKEWDLLKLLPEELELLEILNEIGEELKYGNKFNFEELIEWLNTHNGELPRLDVIINDEYIPIGQLTEEQKKEVHLRRAWNKSTERKILMEFEDMELSEIPEEYREKISILRNYNLDKMYLNKVLEIKKWCERNYGDKPIEDRSLPGIREKSDDEEKAMAARLINLKQTIGKRYEGMLLEDIEDKKHRKIMEVLIYIKKEFGLSDSLKNIIRVKKWCEKKYKDKPPEEKYLPREMENSDEEEKYVARKFKDTKAHMMQRYKDVDIEEIEDEEHREIMKMIKALNEEYGMSESLRNAIRIKKWCEKTYGDKPREARNLPSIAKDRTQEENEIARKLYTIRHNIELKYRNVQLDEIEDEEQRRVVEIVRFLDKEYGISEHLKDAIRIKKWCLNKFGNFKRDKRSWPRTRKKADKEELDLSRKLKELRHEITSKYINVPIEEIKDEEHREIVEIVRFLEENYMPVELIGNDAISRIEKIKKWCEESFKDKPREERRLPSGTAKDEEEKKLGTALNNFRNSVMNKYKEKTLDEIEDENHKKIVEIIRYLDKEYGLSPYLKNAIVIKKWCEENYGAKPREERKIPSRIESNKKESELSIQYKSIRSRVCSKYEGKSLEEIVDEEHREIVEIIRYLDENFMSEEQKKKRDSALNKKMKQAVGKQVAHNEETRQELEGPDKTFVVEDGDVEK